MKDFIRSILKISWLEKIWSQIVSNKQYGLWYTKFTPNHYSYPNPTYRIVQRKGINYKLNLANIVDWNLYFGFKETAKIKLFQLHENPQTVIDVGVNIGEISLNFAKLFPNAKVVGFEPHPETFKLLEQNVALNKFQNLAFYNLGLGSHAGQVHFEERQIGNPGMNRVTANPDKASNTVQITTLDNFCAEHQINTISLIKIDVEGYEMEVLKGARNVLTEMKPVLFIELDDQNLKDQGSSAEELLVFLHSLGYSITRADDDFPLKPTANLVHCHFDIICK